MPLRHCVNPIIFYVPKSSLEPKPKSKCPGKCLLTSKLKIRNYLFSF